MMVVVVVVVVVIAAVPRHDDHTGPVLIIVTAVAIPAVEAVMMVMVVVMMVIIVLRQLDIFARCGGRSGFVDSSQQRSRIRDRLQEVGVGIGPQDFGRVRSRRSLCRAQGAECRHRSQ